MTAGIDQMAEDLAKALALFTRQSYDSLNLTSMDMVGAAQAISSPIYGIVVNARSERTPDGNKVVAEVNQTGGGIGTVFGGLPAAYAAVAKSIEQIAERAGLDRHG
jgi:hypothetical protein